jgi:hypothetical protein
MYVCMYVRNTNTGMNNWVDLTYPRKKILLGVNVNFESKQKKEEIAFINIYVCIFVCMYVCMYLNLCFRFAKSFTAKAADCSCPGLAASS